MAGGDGRTLIAAALVAFLPMGSWMVAYLPLVAAAWAVTMCVGTATTLAVYGTPFFNYTAVLMVFLGIVALTTVLITSRIFVNSLKVEAVVEQQTNFAGSA